MQNMTRIAMVSMTYAMQARELLQRHGISSNIVRLYPGESPNGCAFGLELHRGALQAAYALLKKADIKYTRLYE